MSDFEGSDITGLETETYKKKIPSLQNPKQSGNAYQLLGALKEPRLTTISAKSLFGQLHQNDIDLNAKYQRDIVWPVTKQIGLIDSILHNIYIPPVIFSVTESPDGDVKKVCIDGKQRLTSIQRFMDGLIPHKDLKTNKNYFFKDTRGRQGKGELLPQKYRRIFENKQIQCVEYSDLTDSDEREIFQRVQLGMALTTAEKSQAINSDASVFLHWIKSEYVDDRLAERLDWDTHRATDFYCLSIAVHIIDKNLDSYTTQADAIQKWLKNSVRFSDAVANDICQTFEIFVWLSEDKQCSQCFNLERKGKKVKVSPLEFVATVALIHQHKKKITLPQLSEAIKSMRDHIRSVERDIRLNNRCMRVVITFIKDFKISSVRNDTTNSVATVAIKKVFKPKPKLDEDSDGEEDTELAKKTSAKRKRESSDDECQPKKSTSSQRTVAPQSPTKRSPPTACNLDYGSKTTSSRPHLGSAPFPRFLPSKSSIPRLASPSIPPPSSFSEPRIPPHRPAALPTSKVGIPIPTYQPYQSMNGQYAPHSLCQDTYVMRMGATTSVPDLGHVPHLSSDVRNGYRDDGPFSSNGAYQSTGRSGGPSYSASQRSFSRDDYEHAGDRGESSRYSSPSTRSRR